MLAERIFVLRKMVLGDLICDDDPNFLELRFLYCRIQRSRHCLLIDLQVCRSNFYTYQIMKLSRLHLIGQPGLDEHHYRVLTALL